MAIDTDQYPLPKAADIFANLSGGQKFTKLDLRDAFNQLALNEESQKLCVINTHKGLFRYTRVPFGVSSAPAICQRQMEILLAGIPGVAVSMDDILVTGPEDETHLSRLRAVMKRLKNAGIKLKKEKCEFLKDTLIFLGHKLDAEGLHPMESKMLAIMNAPVPTNVSELRSFLGLLSYYGKFLPHMSSILGPLYSLLQQGSKWIWTTVQNDAFQLAKDTLQRSNVLVHFDPSKEVQLACDASPYGIGCVLSHLDTHDNERPIAFGSRTLTKAERNYSHLEKEALALIYGVTKFRDYLLGRNFTLLTDHRPLTSIFSEQKCIPSLASARIQRWALTLSAFQYKIKFKEGKKNSNADALSRLPIKTLEPDPPSPPEMVLLLSTLDAGPITSTMIKTATATDPVLQRVLTHVLDGWPALVSDDLLRPYFQHRFEITTDSGMLLWGNRVIIPTTLRTSVIHELHDGHRGMTAMKRIARSLLWWPGLDTHIEEVVRRCAQCQEHAAMPAEATPSPWPSTMRPWCRLHLDYAGPINDTMLLIIVDSHSKWIEALPVRTATATNTVLQLRQIFARFGIPDCIVTDNGTCFTAEEFATFLRLNGIRHLRTAPYHPSSNGLAERAVRTVKTGLKKIQDADLHTRLSRFLITYRRTPLNASGHSPAELLFGRNIRTRLDLLAESPSPHHGKKLPRQFQVGHRVMYRNYSKDGPNWLPGRLTRQRGARLYDITTDSGFQITRHVDQIRAAQSSAPEASRSPVTPLPPPFPFPSVGPQQDPEPPPTPSNLRRSTRIRRPPNRLQF